MLRFPLADNEDCPISRLRLISMINRDSHSFIKSRLGDIDINSGQFPLMFLLYYHDGINQGTAALKLNLDKGTVARGMMRLEDSGLIIRKKDDHDRRNYRLSLTPAGRLAMERLHEIRAELESSLVAGMSDEDRRELDRLLQLMHRNVSEVPDG